MTKTPETVLQFGAGRFLRAFADLFVHQSNRTAATPHRIVVVQSTGGGERANALAERGGRYHVAIRGLRGGRPVDEVEEVGSIGRALVAQQDWSAVLELARSPDLAVILSNTTEKGYELADDAADAHPPAAFPAKLAQVLKARFDAGLDGLTLLPCELFERNGDRLRAVVEEQVARWSWPATFVDWLRSACRWRNSLVDRIVSGVPAEHPLLAQDPLLIACEPYALWAIEHPPAESRDRGQFDHPAVHRVADVAPYHLRKVRILNGAHTALVCKAWPRGFQTVRSAVEDKEIGAWLDRLLFEEIVPTVALQAEGAEAFARETLERFRNPFLEHRLSDIALHHEAKVRIRLAATRDEYAARFGREPALLAALLKG